jgi:hypothetical protein
MQISSLHPSFADLGLGGANDQQKVSEGCKQFEAGVWRSFLEKALTPATKSSEGSGVYQYFQTETLAQRMAGQPGGFAAHLEAQLQRNGHSKNP